MAFWTWRRASLIGLAVSALALGLSVSVVRKAPVAVAYLCPTCFGFSDIGGGLVVEDRSSPADRARLVGDIAAARETVASFYGELQGRNSFIICFTDACDARMGGPGPKALTYADALIYLAPSGLNPTIIAHELSHVELHSRLGADLIEVVPAWFNEGLAVIVSRDERYVDPGRTGAGACRVEDDGRPLPVGEAEWSAAADAGDHSIYAWAACRVSLWLSGHDGAKGVADLIAAMRNGRAFSVE